MFSRKDISSADSTVSTVKKIYFYLVTFIALIMIAMGSSQLIQFILESIFARNIIQTNVTLVALAISLLLVGIPTWIIHWRIVQKQININSAEELSVVRTVFIYTILAISIAALTSSIIGILQFLLGAKESSWLQIAGVLPYSIIWAYHWGLSKSNELNYPSRNLIQRIYVYSACIFGLIMLSTGIGGILYTILKSGYEVIFNAPILFENESNIWESLKDPLTYLISGLFLWLSHWMLFGLQDNVTKIRSFYLYIIAIVGGIIPITTASISLLYGLFQFLLQVNSEDSIIPQLPGSISSISVGLILFTYHYYFIKSTKNNNPSQLNSQKKVFGYLLSFIGIISASIGISILIQSIMAAIAEALGNTIYNDSETNLDIISFALALIVVGGFLWGYCYKKIQLFTKSDHNELSSIRRIYLISILGLSTVISVIVGTSGLFVILRDILSNDVGVNTLESISIPISILITYFIVAPYHWVLYKREPSNDKKSAPTITNSIKKKSVTILLPDDNKFFLGQLEDDIGYSIKSVRWVDPHTSSIQLDLHNTKEIADLIKNTTGNNVIIIPEKENVRIYSYE